MTSSTVRFLYVRPEDEAMSTSLRVVSVPHRDVGAVLLRVVIILVVLAVSPDVCRHRRRHPSHVLLLGE